MIDMYVVRYEDTRIGETVYYKYTSKYYGIHSESIKPKFTDDIMKAKQFKTLDGAENWKFVLSHDYNYPKENLSVEEI